MNQTTNPALILLDICKRNGVPEEQINVESFVEVAKILDEPVKAPAFLFNYVGRVWCFHCFREQRIIVSTTTWPVCCGHAMWRGCKGQVDAA